MSPETIALIGDLDLTVVAHGAIPRALTLAAAALGVSAISRWLAFRFGGKGTSTHPSIPSRCRCGEPDETEQDPS